MHLPWQRAIWNPIRRPRLSVRLPRVRGGSGTRTAGSPLPAWLRERLAAPVEPAPVRVETIEVNAYLTVRVVR